MPFNFTHREYLLALGLAHEQEGEEDPQLVFSLSGLASYRPPDPRTDGLVLQPQERMNAMTGHRYTVMAVVPGATRLDPIAAQWLWAHRTALETDPALPGAGVVTASAWCTHCGRYFEARTALGELRRIRRWCDACQGRSARHRPQAVKCAVPTCDHWFTPAKQGRQKFCTPACEQAARRMARAQARYALPG